MNKVNYQKQMEDMITHLQGQKKKLLLHSCCAPCSSYVLKSLQPWFDITVYYYNPNITDLEEYEKRAAEQQRLIDTINLEQQRQAQLQQLQDTQPPPDKDTEETAFFPPIRFCAEEYAPSAFYQAVKGTEHIPEGGERCARCFELRLRRTAQKAASECCDYFTTTLTISPLKDADTLNQIGLHLAEEYHIPFLPSDFKKKNGYKQSVQLSEQYGLYRQDYCGCIFSKTERR